MSGVVNQRDEKKAKAAAARQAKKKIKVEWQGYVECYLNKDQKKELKELDESREYNLETLLSELTDSGYKVSFSKDQQQGTYTVTLYDQAPDSEFAGYALSGRGKSLWGGWTSICYKHFLILVDGWQRAAREDSDYD